eukprot:6195357-Amphidinium_carterae.1
MARAVVDGVDMHAQHSVQLDDTYFSRRLPARLKARGYDQHWTWQQANSLESASFHDLFNNLCSWAP